MKRLITWRKPADLDAFCETMSELLGVGGAGAV
jgi:hypothetical protein